MQQDFDFNEQIANTEMEIFNKFQHPKKHLTRDIISQFFEREKKLRSLCDEEREEYENEYSRDRHNDLLLFAEAVREELGNSDRVVRSNAVSAESLGDDKPVEVGTDGQTDGGPGGLRQATHHGDGRKTHEEPAAHVGGLRAHGGDQGTQLTAAEEEIARGLILFRDGHTNGQHHAHVQDDGK